MNHDLLIAHRSRAEHCETATLPGPLLREILDIALREEDNYASELAQLRARVQALEAQLNDV